MIAEQAARLQHLLDALLDLSRIQIGRFSVEIAPFDLGQLTSRVVEEIQSMQERHTITLRCLTAGPIVVRGDSLRLAQVVHNLIGNAIKYSPAGGPVMIQLAYADDERRSVCLSVGDRGIGIPSAALPYLFERFYRAPNVTAAGALDGFGIGLYIVREIVERHGGAVKVESEEGWGSTFTVRLPVDVQGAEASAIHSGSSRPSSA
jgi:signal transduction histidine kinase